MQAIGHTNVSSRRATGPGWKTSTDQYGPISDPRLLPFTKPATDILFPCGTTSTKAIAHLEPLGLTGKRGHIILVISTRRLSCKKWLPHNSRLNVSP